MVHLMPERKAADCVQYFEKPSFTKEQKSPGKLRSSSKNI